MASLANDFVVNSGVPWLGMSGAWTSNAVARFSGALRLNGPLHISINNGKGQWSAWGQADADSHEWAGPVVLDQGAVRSLRMDLSGPIDPRVWSSAV